MSGLIDCHDGRQYEVVDDDFDNVDFIRSEAPDPVNDDLDQNPIVGIRINRGILMNAATVFERKRNLDIGGALSALKNGKKVRRAGWHAKDKYLWYKPPVAIKAEWCKDEALKGIAEKNGGQIDSLGVICMYLTENEKPLILTGWHPTPCDFLEEDWEIIG